MPRVLIVGAGALGQQIAGHLSSRGEGAVAGFVDDTVPVGTPVSGHSVLGGIAAAEALFDAGEADTFLLGVGYRHFAFRQTCFETLSAFAEPDTFVHPDASVDPSASVGRGTVVLAGCVIDRQVTIGENVFLNVGCALAHDTQVGAHSFLGPGIAVSGEVRIGARNFIGVGTSISDGVCFADDVQTGAGAVVVRDCTEAGLYVGVPARKRR